MTSITCSNSDPGVLFTPLSLANITLKNRILRSATYEGMGNPDGFPRDELAAIYQSLARGGVTAIITGFVYISQAGRAMHPGQCGMDAEDKIAAWKNIVRKVKEDVPHVCMFMQLAHTGRQTRQEATGHPVLGVSSRKCSYFRQGVHVLTDSEIKDIILEFGKAAFRAKQAGFDGVQIHAAHGYLIHQFLSPWTNLRKDRWAERTLFLEETLREVKRVCGDKYPVLVKLSAAEDTTPGIQIENTIDTVKCLESTGIDAVEISYGTMEYALNIIRGSCPIDLVLEVNPLFNKIPWFLRKIWKRFRAKAYTSRLIPFQENYNVASAARIKAATSLPVIAVGGIRTKSAMIQALSQHRLDAISLCRPLLCEPDLPLALLAGKVEQSRCTNCNFCTIYCDSQQTLRCYQK